MCHVCTAAGLTPATSAPGLGSSLPHLHRDWAHHCHICTGTGLTPATSAPRLGSPLPHLHRDWAAQVRFLDDVVRKALRQVQVAELPQGSWVSLRQIW
jgi:hypothetical protein